jgi:hypothetical protein
MQEIRRIEVGINNQGFESIFGEIDASIMEIMIPFILIMIFDLLSAMALNSI